MPLVYDRRWRMAEPGSTITWCPRAAMESERWQRKRELFEQALELPAEERESFLRAACDGDADLLRDVSVLVEADARAGIFLDQPLVRSREQDASPESLRPGD